MGMPLRYLDFGVTHHITSNQFIFQVLIKSSSVKSTRGHDHDVVGINNVDM
jgi:hypothetical protein